MLWCQGAQNIGLSALKCSVHCMITMHARPRQTDVPSSAEYTGEVVLIHSSYKPLEASQWWSL